MTNPPLDLLKYRAFPEVADALKVRVPKILQRFQQIVRQVLPAAEELTLNQLLNSLPLVLQQMAEALESDEPAATFELLDISQPHGEIRFHQHYNVNELLIEYHLIRRIVIEEATDALSRPLSAEESVALNLGIDTSQRRGVVVFVDSQTRQLRDIADLQTRYLSFLSHDLRGGLNGTLLMVEVLKRELAGSAAVQSVQDLEVMRHSILETVATLDRFLNAERLRKGVVRASPSRIDLSGLVRDVAGQVNFVAQEKGLAVALSVPEYVHVVSDRDLLAMVLQSLLDNAVKFTRKGTVRIHVECGAPSRDGPIDRESRTISVQDEGPGIPPEKLLTLFNPFKQVEGRKNPGLGLLIAKQAADLIDAKITVTSEVGKGSTFSVILPEIFPAEK